MEHPVLLEMRGISKTFPGVKALDNVQPHRARRYSARPDG